HGIEVSLYCLRLFSAPQNITRSCVANNSDRSFRSCVSKRTKRLSHERTTLRTVCAHLFGRAVPSGLRNSRIGWRQGLCFGITTAFFAICTSNFRVSNRAG